MSEKQPTAPGKRPGAAGGEPAAGEEPSGKQQGGSGPSGPGTERPPASARPRRRRQARGQRRIEQLLEAAARVIGDHGYDGASTNAIAREAGVSPGTLYQFFPNKEAIAIELGGRLLDRMRETHGQVFTPENAMLPLAEALDRIVDPLTGFICHNPASLALMHAPGAPAALADEHAALDSVFRARTAELIALRAPGLPPEQCARAAMLAYTFFTSGMELAMSHEGAEREAYVAELKAALHRYLAPLVGTEAPATD
ncbi:TetR/AcrR family transcriptional regulator [Streptomyces sp. MNU89]|uniref:TetR/AcrR family transcriptional regulator n=1 Tax=Streptomyces sp. MNU89 TaxID=2560025 RepID=UPI001E310C33|nr:TetR/AcrR family transcriptional regulator [Streptomyces sp. MNU89]MCC9741507.1 TetR/AcrR family transcriptional regulator [Streptomyces sp. MNU89]